MVAAQTGRYSKYIRPISIGFDLVVLTFFCGIFFEELNLDMTIFIFYQKVSWAVISYFI